MLKIVVIGRIDCTRNTCPDYKTSDSDMAAQFPSVEERVMRRSEGWNQDIARQGATYEAGRKEN